MTHTPVAELLAAEFYDLGQSRLGSERLTFRMIGFITYVIQILNKSLSIILGHYIC